MFNLIRHLSTRHHLSVLAFYETTEEFRYADSLAPYCDDLELVFRYQNFYDRDPFGVDPPEITHEFYNRYMQNLVEARLRTGRYDLMQCEYLQTAHFANIDPRVPTVLTNHEVASLAYDKRFRAARGLSLSKLKSMIRWMRMLNYEAKLLPRFSAVVVLTPIEREFLARLVPGLPVYAHPMGVDCDFFSPTQEEPESESIVFVGNFRHAPNLSGAHWFIDQVWPRVLARMPHAKFYVVGGHAPDSLLRHHGQSNICMTGFVDDIRPYLQRSAVFVAPIFAGAGARTKVLEAWAMEKPVVGTSLAFEGIRNDSELCMSADEPDAFAERVQQLLSNRQLIRHLGRRARQMVIREFSWESFAEFYEDIYSKIVEPGVGKRVEDQNAKLGISRH